MQACTNKLAAFKEHFTGDPRYKRLPQGESINERYDMADTGDNVSAHGQTLEDAADFSQLLRTNQRLIGIDAGSKTLGLALSDVTRTIASPLETIRRTKFKTDAERLLQLAEEHDVGGLVLGLPANLDGSEGPRAQSARAMARNFNALSALPMLLWDERLSTVAAERTLIEADASRKRRSEVIDKVAATIILQSALDRMNAL